MAESVDVVVTVRLTIPKDSMYFRGGELRIDMVKEHAVYVLDRADPNPVVDVEILGEIPGETRPTEG